MRYSFILSLLITATSWAQVDSFTYFANHKNDIATVAYSPDGKYIVTGSWDNTVIIHKNDSTAEAVQVLPGFRGVIKTIAFSRDGYKLLVGGQDGELTFYDFNSEYFEIATKDTSFTIDNTPINKLIYGPGMRMIFSAGGNGQFTAYDLVKQKTMPVNGTKSITAAAVSIDRRSYFIAVKGSPIINQVDIFGKTIKTFEGHSNDITDLLVTVDRKYLISSSKDKTIRIWEIVNAKEETAFRQHTWTVTDIDIDPLGRYLVSGSLDGKVYLYDLKARSLKDSFVFEGYKVNAVALSPDFSQIVAAAQPDGVTNPAGFFSIPSGIPGRKIVMPEKMDLEALRAKNNKRTQKKTEEKKRKAAEKESSSATESKNEAHVENQNEQVKITIRDNE